MDRPIHVVGGGLAGLVAAVTAAEAGAPVVLHEAGARLGGRALGGTNRAGVNLGPHVVFTDGALVRWLRARHIPVPLRLGLAHRVRVVDDGGAHLPMREVLELLPTLARRTAPSEEDFRSWADASFGASRAELLCRLAGLFTFHHDPGSLSAAFVWERYRRTFLTAERCRWIAGGWTTLAGALEARAGALGVVIERGRRITAGELPDEPTVVATPLATASRLLERRLAWPGARTALLDVVAHGGRRWPSIVADVRSDLATCCMVERETAIEPGLAGADGLELFQAHLGIAADVDAADAVARIEDAFDRAVPRWREQTVWRRGHVVVDGTGAVDPPGTTWRDRPAVVQGDDRFLAGDAVAAPGLLSEVAVNSAVRAAHLALDARRRRVFAAGWPSVSLTPERRLAVLAAVLPSASLRTVGDPDAVAAFPEPVDERGPDYAVDVGLRTVRAVALSTDERGARVTTLVARRPRIWRGLARVAFGRAAGATGAARPSRIGGRRRRR